MVVHADAGRLEDRRDAQLRFYFFFSVGPGPHHQ